MKATKLFLIVLVLLQDACSRESEKTADRVAPAVVKEVTVEVMKPTGVSDSFEAAGTIKASKTAILSGKVMGTIVAVAVKEGDKVRKGQTLVQIDSRELQAELAGAHAGLEELNWVAKGTESALAAAQGQRELAAATYQRYEALLARGSVTRQEFDEVNAKFKVATAEVNHAQENLRALGARKEQARARISQTQALLNQTSVVAPFNGVVTEKAAEVGTLATPATALMTVEEEGAYRLEAQIGESQIRWVTLGKTAVVSIDAIGSELSGTVVEIVPAADSKSRTFTAKVQLPPDGQIRSGLYGKARWPTRARPIIAVPKEAIIERGQLSGVFVVDERELVRFRLVTSGKGYGDRVEVLSGLTEGERVVVKSARGLREGDKVRIEGKAHAG